MRFCSCIFDLYGTLADIRTDEEPLSFWEETAAWYASHGAPWAPEALRAAYRVSVVRREEELAARTGADFPEIRIEDVFAELFSVKGVQAGPALIGETGRRFRERSRLLLRLYDGAAELLRALRESGRGVYLLSNAQRLFTEPELESLGIAGLFDAVYISSDWGCKKPDRRFFQALLAGQGIAPESAVMVGNDGASDIAGARALGLATVYIRSDISPREPLPEADLALEEMDLDRVGKFLLS